MKKNKCLYCKKKIDCVPFTLEHGYGSPYDEESWDFCSAICLILYVVKKIKIGDK